MKSLLAATAALSLAALTLAIAASARADGDAAKGERDFGKCKVCHSIADGDTVIQKGGTTGPNLFGIVGRPAASYPGFSYGPGIRAAADKGLVWTVDELVTYVHDPSAFLTDYVGKPEKSKMTFKMKNSDDVVAYLASLGEHAGD